MIKRENKKKKKKNLRDKTQPLARHINSRPRLSQEKVHDKLTLVILGRSGSGKGTQAKFIMRRLGRAEVRHIESGKFLRWLIKKRKNVTTALVERIVRRGDLVPSWLPAYYWLGKLIMGGYGNKHLVFDGSPRHIWETQLLDRVMRDHGRPLPLGIYIKVSEAEATERLLLRGRPIDDNKPAIKNRMKFFAKYVVPTIRYYEKENRLIRINGSPPVEAVWREIDEKLRKRLGKQWPSP